MVRQRPPSAAADPRLDLSRHRLRQANVATPGELRRVIEEELRNAPSTPRVPPVLSGSWTDDQCTAGQQLARILQDLGLIIDRSTT